MTGICYHILGNFWNFLSSFSDSICHCTKINALLKLLGDRDEAMAKWLESVFNVVLSAEVTEQLEAESYSQISGGDPDF